MKFPVVIAAFRSSDEAAAAQRALLQEGIAADAGKRMSGIPRFCADAFDAGFDVAVSAADAERGIAILRRLWPDEIEATPLPTCPSCGSIEIARLPRLVVFVVFAAAMVVFAIFFGEEELFLLAAAIVGAVLVLTPRNRCRACGERWR